MNTFIYLYLNGGNVKPFPHLYFTLFFVLGKVICPRDNEDPPRRAHYRPGPQEPGA